MNLTTPPNAGTDTDAPATDRASGCCVERLVLRWPVKIRHEIGEWLGGALCGHGSKMSRAAARRWRYLLKKLESQNDKSSPIRAGRDGGAQPGETK